MPALSEVSARINVSPRYRAHYQHVKEAIDPVGGSTQPNTYNPIYPCSAPPRATFFERNIEHSGTRRELAKWVIYSGTEHEYNDAISCIR